MTYKQFADVSFYQDKIDWDKMREMSDAVLIRAGQGTWKDKWFDINYVEAKKRGMLRGIYWFYDDTFSPGAQMEALKKALGGDLPELEIFWDWERTYKGKFGGVKNVVAAMEATERTFPTADVGMYTGYFWFFENTHAVKNYFQLQYLKNKPLWLAQYNVQYPSRVPRPWTKPRYWQWGTPAVDWGQSSKEIDMNYFLGEEFEFYLRFAQTGDPMYEGQTNTLAKVWDKPPTEGGTQISQIQAGVTVRGYAPVGDFVQLVEPIAGWTKKVWLSNYVETTPPEPPPTPELPAYFTAHDLTGQVLGYYDLRTP